MRSRVPIRLLAKVVTRTPDLIPFFGKSLYRKHFGVDKDYRQGDGIARKAPSMVSLRITNACNHRCAVCGQHGAKGYMHTDKRGQMRDVLPYESYAALIDELADHKPVYYILGGEPFLYRDLMRVMRHIKDRGSAVSIVTNGVRLKQYAEQIVRDEWDLVFVSLDGPEAIHDQCRRFPGAYKAVHEGLVELWEWRKRLKKARPYLSTLTTMSTVNVNSLVETFDIGRELKVDLMVVYPSWFTSEKIGKAQEKLLKEHLGVDAYTWKSYERTFSESEAQAFADSLMGLRDMKWPFHYMLLPELKTTEDIKAYYLEPSRMFGYDKCVAPFSMAEIMANGDVVTCRDFTDVKVGNITENGLLDIWNGEMFVKFRKLLIDKGGLLPQCSRCCGLMGY